MVNKIVKVVQVCFIRVEKWRLVSKKKSWTRFEFFLEPIDKIVVDFKTIVLLKINGIEIDKNETYIFLKSC